MVPLPPSCLSTCCLTLGLLQLPSNIQPASEHPQSQSSLWGTRIHVDADNQSRSHLPRRQRSQFLLPTSPAVPEPSLEVFRFLADPDLSIASICQLVNFGISPIINESQIVESRVYIERGLHIAPHRKIVVKVRPRGGPASWLLLERKPTSASALVKGFGVPGSGYLHFPNQSRLYVAGFWGLSSDASDISSWHRRWRKKASRYFANSANTVPITTANLEYPSPETPSRC